eukprot:10765610-Alexandrium_andersonii.AAC.1
MSASLVGSEMCIRDRRLSNVQLTVPAHANSTRIRINCPGCALEVQVVPVSYTHLTLPTICSV